MEKYSKFLRLIGDIKLLIIRISHRNGEKNKDLTDNVFTLTLNKDTKLYFLNGNNENGYYSWDFMIYRMGEEDELLFKSSL